VGFPKHTVQLMGFGYAEYIRNLLEFASLSHIDGLKENSHLFGSHQNLPLLLTTIGVY